MWMPKTNQFDQLKVKLQQELLSFTRLGVKILFPIQKWIKGKNQARYDQETEVATDMVEVIGLQSEKGRSMLFPCKCRRNTTLTREATEVRTVFDFVIMLTASTKGEYQELLSLFFRTHSLFPARVSLGPKGFGLGFGRSQHNHRVKDGPNFCCLSCQSCICVETSSFPLWNSTTSTMLVATSVS